MFIAKFNAKGQLLWSTYYGGNGEDYGFSIAVQGDRVVIVGATKSTNGTRIATTNSHQSSHGGSSGYNDGFIAQFDTTGKRRWATYYGGPDADYDWALSTDAAGSLPRWMDRQ